MDTDTAKANEKRFFEHVNSRDTAAMALWIDRYVADGFVNHTPVFDVPGNKEGLKEMFRILFKVFPEMTFAIKEMLFENNMLSFRYVIRGMKKDKDVVGIAMVAFENERITDRWAVTEPV